MHEKSTDAPAPNGILLGLSAFAVTGVALVAWLLIALVAVVSARWDPEWAYTGLALPGATIGSLAAYQSRRPLYLWLGLAVTLIPLAAYLLLLSTTPEPPPTFVD